MKHKEEKITIKMPALNERLHVMCKRADNAVRQRQENARKVILKCKKN